MPLDPVIAQGFRGIELQNPLDAYARVNQLQQAQQQNQLNALKMQDYQREVETTNRLRSLDPSAPNYMSEVTRLNPELGSQLMLRSKPPLNALPRHRMPKVGLKISATGKGLPAILPVRQPTRLWARLPAALSSLGLQTKQQQARS
jgi:hypothetical protein